MQSSLSLDERTHKLVSMRTVREFTHPAMKITLFHWNNKYILKLEQDDLEQTFKISEFDVVSEDAFIELLTDSFYAEAQQRFADMNKSMEALL